MTYTLEIKKEYALRIIKELQKVDAVKLRKVSKNKKVSEIDEEIALVEAMKEADFSDTVSEETIMAKLRTK